MSREQAKAESMPNGGEPRGARRSSSDRRSDGGTLVEDGGSTVQDGDTVEDGGTVVEDGDTVVEGEEIGTVGDAGVVREIDHDEFDPVGTLALILVYLAILVVMWFFMYFVEFLGNGPTVVG